MCVACWHQTKRIMMCMCMCGVARIGTEKCGVGGSEFREAAVGEWGGVRERVCKSGHA